LDRCTNYPRRFTYPRHPRAKTTVFPQFQKASSEAAAFLRQARI
jgi:hypothetical protein